MQYMLSVTGIRPHFLFLLFLLITPLLTTGCSTIKAISMMRGGSTEQGTLLRDEPVEAGKIFHLMTVKVRINDSAEALNFMVDTAAYTVIDEQVAKKITFKDSVQVESRDIAGNKKDVRVVQVGRISVGNVHVSDCAAMIVNLKKLSPKLDGILGSNFLKYFKVQLDYPNSRLTFMHNTGTQINNDTNPIPMWLNMKAGFAPTMKCDIDSVVTVDCVLDTGHPSIASIPSSVIDELPHFKSGEFITSIGSMGEGAFGNIRESQLVKTDKITLGSLSIKNITADTNHSGMMTLGYEYLKNFLVTIDYPNSLLYLKPYLGHKVDNTMLSFGFGINKEQEKTIVSGLWKGGSADKAGISVGDELVSLNGAKTIDIAFFDIAEVLKATGSLNVSYIKKSTGTNIETTLYKTDLTLLLPSSPNK